MKGWLAGLVLGASLTLNIVGGIALYSAGVALAEKDKKLEALNGQIHGESSEK